MDLKIDVSWFPALDSLFHLLFFVQSKTTLHIFTMNFFSNYIDLSAGFEWSTPLVILVYDLWSPWSKLQESGAIFIWFIPMSLGLSMLSIKRILFWHIGDNICCHCIYTYGCDYASICVEVHIYYITSIRT